MTPTFLATDLAALKCDLDGGTTLLSALRLWEHGVLGQVNVTGSPISPRYWASQAPRYIDVIQRVDGIDTIVCSLQDIYDADATIRRAGEPEPDFVRNYLHNSVLREAGWQTNTVVLAMQREVKRFLYHLSHRLAERGAPNTFFPTKNDFKSQASTLGIPGLHSKLIVFLKEKCIGRHKVESWLAMLESGQRQGFKAEELRASGLISWLSQQEVTRSDRCYSAQDLIEKITWSDIRLSVMPVVQYTDTPITLEPQTEPKRYRARGLSRVKEGSKPQIGQRRFLHEYDPILGYRVEGIEHETVWGREVHWQAVTFRGEPIKNQWGFSLLTKPEVAHQLAIHHAQRMLPKREPKDLWIDYTLPGGEKYREWLVTLPWYPVTHEENHFDLRNVLIHIRCDDRQAEQGRKILFLQEVQSDWAQSWAQLQREQGLNSAGTNSIPQPPFSKEWLLLAVKLMLLHAAAWDYDGIAWVTGAMQAEQFGRERAWFRTLYDQMLPKFMSQVMAPHGGEVIQLHLTDDEDTKEVMGVILEKLVRQSLRSRGIPIWG